MAWNPYSDQKNRAYSNLLTSLFPEQTKTFSRIIVWSIIFLADLILGVVAAAYFGLLEYGKLSAGLVVAVIVAVFWLQGRIWYAIVNWFHNRNKLD